MNVRFPCSNPRRLPCSDCTALIIDIRQYRRLLSTCAGLIPYLPSWGYSSPSKRGSSKERGWRQDGEAVEGEEKGQLDGKPAGPLQCRGQDRRGVEDAIQCFNLYSHESSLYFSVSYLHTISINFRNIR